MRKLISKFDSKCHAPECPARQIKTGEWIWYERDYGAFHEACAPNGKVPPGTMTNEEWRNRKFQTPEQIYHNVMNGLAIKNGQVVTELELLEDEMVLPKSILVQAGEQFAKKNKPPAYNQDFGKSGIKVTNDHPQTQFHVNGCVLCKDALPKSNETTSYPKKCVRYATCGNILWHPSDNYNTKNMCDRCWESAQQTVEADQSAKPVESVNTAVKQIEEIAVKKPEAKPTEPNGLADRFALIELE